MSGVRLRVAPLITIALISMIAIAACGEDDSNARAPETTATVSAAPTLPEGSVPPGTVVLFDMESLTAQELDLGRAIIRAEMIDDGETIVALDANTQTWLALKVDGTLLREIAAQATSSGEGSPALFVSSVHDGSHAALADLRTRRFDLVDVRSGDTETLFGEEPGFGYFSYDGAYMAGGTTPVGADGAPDYDAATLGVFARDGDCGDSTPYACVEWEWPRDDGMARFPTADPWAPDGRHLLLSRQRPCPPDSPSDAPAPCSPDSMIEVYSWPEHRLVWKLPVPSSGSVRWAGSSALWVDGAFDETLGGARYLVTLDGEKRALPEVLGGFAVSFSPDGRYAIASAIPGEDCSLIEVETGDVLAGVPAGPGDTNDTGICQHVSWSPNGRWAVATGVNTP